MDSVEDDLHLDHPLTSAKLLAVRGGCSSAVPLGMPYILRVRHNTTAPFGFRVASGAPHALTSTPNGAAALHAAVTGPDGCSLRH